MHNKIRFGVLGASRIAKKAAIPAIIASTHAELAMVGSRTPANVQGFDCPASSYENVLANPNIDAVYISLPNSLHEEWSVRALEAGKHVWCEKPAALSYASAQKMVTAARANNVRLMEGFMFLYHPQQKRVREIIQSGTLGEITGFEGRFAFPMPDVGNIRLNARLGGGIYYDALVYPIRASRFAFGEEPQSITCNLTIDPALGVDVKADATLTYSGRTASISSAFDSDYRSTYRVLGTKGSISMERAYAVPKDLAVRIFLEVGNAREEICIEPADHFKLMVDDFCSEVALGEASTKRYEEDLLVQAHVVDAGRRSFQEKRVVRLSELS
ncbi:MAG: Gfo/Idh/MocA family oxidoreductase [Patescibacteria group bacterium]